MGTKKIVSDDEKLKPNVTSPDVCQMEPHSSSSETSSLGRITCCSNVLPEKGVSNPWSKVLVSGSSGFQMTSPPKVMPTPMVNWTPISSKASPICAPMLEVEKPVSTPKDTVSRRKVLWK